MTNQLLPYARPTAWRSQGQSVQGAKTSAEAITAAGLGGWNVHLEGFKTDSGGACGEWRAIVKNDGKVLGVATTHYKPIQNEQGFDFLDALVANGSITYDAAGSLMGGRKVWLTARLNTDVRIGSDDYVEYLLILMGHDNYTSFKVYTTKERVICGNIILRATSRATPAMRIIHSGDVQRKLDTSRAILRSATSDHQKMTEWLEKMMWKSIPMDLVIDVRNSLFGQLGDSTPIRRSDAIDNFMNIFEVEQAREGRTAYALAQTITGYGDHMINLRTRVDGEERMRALLDGSSQAFKKKGFAALVRETSIAAPAGIFN